MLFIADALYHISKPQRIWHDHTVILVIFHQDLAFSNVKNLEKQALYKQEEGRHSFQPS